MGIHIFLLLVPAFPPALRCKPSTRFIEQFRAATAKIKDVPVERARE